MRIINSQPVINNMNQSYYQQPTIGQIGQYYGSQGNPYNQYGYNPYNNLSPDYYKEQERLRQEHMRQEYDNVHIVNKMLNRCISKYNDEEIPYNEPLQYEDYTKQQNEIISKQEEYNTICSLDELFRREESRLESVAEEYKALAEEANADTRGLLEFFETSGNERLREQREEGLFKARHDVGALYNSEAFNNLLNIHNNNGIFSERLNVDDINITLPSNLMNEYAQKRAAFMRAITGGANNG